MFLRNKKISKKIVKLSSFLQCSVNIFPGNDGCFKNFVKLYHEEFQVKHGQSDSIIFPKTFSFQTSKSLLDLCLVDSRILYFWQALESTQKFLMELHVLQCLFVRGSNFTKRKIFFISHDSQVLLRVIPQCAPPLLASSKKGLLLVFSLK